MLCRNSPNNFGREVLTTVKQESLDHILFQTDTKKKKQDKGLKLLYFQL